MFAVPPSQMLISPKANERVHLAGQIPLVPASLTLPPAPLPHVTPYARQAALALQHVRKLIEVLRSKNSTGGGWSGWGESCVAWYTRPDGYGSEGPRVVTDAWNLWALEVSTIDTSVSSKLIFVEWVYQGYCAVCACEGTTKKSTCGVSV